MKLTRLLFLILTGYCSAGFCFGGLDPSPTPNAEKRRILQPGQVRQQLCPAGMTACPVQSKGYEVSLRCSQSRLILLLILRRS
jgi:hypothetical protein